MKRIILAAVATMLMTGAALAADPLAPAYGNTVTQTLPDGTKLTIYINADMTWEQHMGSQTFKGTYAWQDGTHVCFTVTDPAPADPSKAKPACNEIKGDHKVGDTWSETTPQGQSITMAITAGR